MRLLPLPLAAALVLFHLSIFHILAKIFWMRWSLRDCWAIIFAVDGLWLRIMSYPSRKESMPSTRSCQKRPPAAGPPCFADEYILKYTLLKRASLWSELNPLSFQDFPNSVTSRGFWSMYWASWKCVSSHVLIKDSWSCSFEPDSLVIIIQENLSRLNTYKSSCNVIMMMMMMIFPCY